MRTTRNVVPALLLCCSTLLHTACSGDSPSATDLAVDGVAPTTAHFSAEYHRGHLTLDGHAASAEHEQQLVDLATQRFAGATRSINLDLLDGAPGHWRVTTVRLVDALAATQSASAVLTSNKLSVRGIALDDWSNRWVRLRASLPESVALEIDVIEPDRDISVTDLCARAMAQFRAGPIKFEESGTEFRNSALPTLERVIALANACRDSVIEIIGHTDASGDEYWNQRLSLARAQAVADYLKRHGIVADRLKTVGVGSALPVADNQTRYGRSLNRRIDIQFHAADDTALKP